MSDNIGLRLISFVSSEGFQIQWNMAISPHAKPKEAIV